jgi:hypothetical protein
MNMHPMRSGLLGIVLTYLVVAGAEVAFHWHIGAGNSPVARRLAAAYFQRGQRRSHE